MGPVDDSHYSLVIAAAQAAGPCPPGGGRPPPPPGPGTAPPIMGPGDASHYSLVIAAAQAAGPCPPGEEAAWGRRVHGLTVDLHLIAHEAKQDMEGLGLSGH